MANTSDFVMEKLPEDFTYLPDQYYALISIMLYHWYSPEPPEFNGHEIGPRFGRRDKEFGRTVHEGSPALMIKRNIY